MTHPQILAFGILAATMLLFIWGRLRYDLVAILSLLASIAAGTVPASEAFSSFSDDIIIIVASALVLSAAIARSGIIESSLAVISRHVVRVRCQLTVLVGSVTILSALVKNIGALAMLMPAALRMAKKSETSASVFLMPMAFGSLLGGLITLIGTSPNIIVSRVREEMTGEPFRMFDYAPVGLCLSAVGLVFLHFGYRLLPRDRRAAPTMGEAVDITDYTTEAGVPADSSVIGMTAEEFHAANQNEVEITAVLRGEKRARVPLRNVVLEEGDVLLLKGDPDQLGTGNRHRGPGTGWARTRRGHGNTGRGHRGDRGGYHHEFPIGGTHRRRNVASRAPRGESPGHLACGREADQGTGRHPTACRGCDRYPRSAGSPSGTSW